MNLPPKKRLGRGLDGLLPPAPPPASAPTGRAPSLANIDQLHPNREQPRKVFDDEELGALAQSIAEVGIVQPIAVRKRAVGGYEIVSGERRWRAAQRAGVHEVPIHVVELEDDRAYVASMVENLQRVDLNPVETALGFQRLIDTFGMTQEEVAQKVGKSRVSVTNALRLLKLPTSVLDMVRGGQLSEGHGRALLQAHDAGTMEKLARAAHQGGWSVRDLERKVRGGAGPGKKGASAEPQAPAKSANVKDLERRISHALGVAVEIQEGPGSKGKLVLAYGDYDELDRILGRILG
ncbi:MAG: ParB/RepB/Spo0J family partition protein [Polyangiales bacterium]